MIRRYVIGITLFIVFAGCLRLFIGTASDPLLTIKAWLIPVAVIYLDTFNNPATALSLSFVMGVVGLAVIVFFGGWRFSPVNSELRQIVKRLHALDAPVGSPNAFEAIDQMLSASDLLARPWRAYKVHIGLTGDGHYYCLEKPSAQFKLSSLTQVERSSRTLQAVAGDFVGVGLVFTFLGLVAGLYFAGRSMLSADLSAARQALIQLLHASTFKFLTSIMGIGMSLTVTWASRLFTGRTERLLDELTLWLEDFFFADVRLINPDPGQPRSHSLLVATVGH